MKKKKTQLLVALRTNRVSFRLHFAAGSCSSFSVTSGSVAWRHTNGLVRQLMEWTGKRVAGDQRRVALLLSLSAAVYRFAVIPLSYPCGSSRAVLCGSAHIFCLQAAAGCLAKGRRRFTFWLQSMRFLCGLRGIFAVSCGSLRLYNRRDPQLKPYK